MAHTMLDDWKVLPRLMMLAITIMCFQVTNWMMSLNSQRLSNQGFCSVIFGCFSACFAVWMGRETTTMLPQTRLSTRKSMTSLEDFMVFLMIRALEFLLNTKMSLYGTVIV